MLLGYRLQDAGKLYDKHGEENMEQKIKMEAFKRKKGRYLGD